MCPIAVHRTPRLTHFLEIRQDTVGCLYGRKMRNIGKRSRQKRIETLQPAVSYLIGQE
jgi:hypothetical protein